MKLKLSILILKVFIFLVNCIGLTGQIPPSGTFAYTYSTEVLNGQKNPFIDIISETEEIVFYNDTLFVSLNRPLFQNQSYCYINRKNGNCIVIDRVNGNYVKTNIKTLKEYFDIFGFSKITDSIPYEIADVDCLGDNCQKMFKKSDSLGSSYFIINEKLSYFSEAEGKNNYFPVEEWSNLGDYIYSKKFEKIDTTLDYSIFNIDTLGLTSIDLKSYVDFKLGFQIVSDSLYSNNQLLQNTFLSLPVKRDYEKRDSMSYIYDAIRKFKFNANEVTIDSIKSIPGIDYELTKLIEQKYKVEGLDEIIRKYYYKKTLSTKSSRRIILENLHHAKIKLKNNRSPLTLYRFIEQGYSLDHLISELKGYHRVEVDLRNIDYKSFILSLLETVLPEYSQDPISIQVKPNEIHIGFKDNVYKLYLGENDDSSSLIERNRHFVKYEVDGFFTKLFVDLDLPKRIGISRFNEMQLSYVQTPEIDTFFVCVFDNTFEIKEVNIAIGLSFHDSVKVMKQLSLINLYCDECGGFISLPINYNLQTYLKSSQLREFQSFYKFVGSNNKYIRKMMLDQGNDIPYALTEMGMVFSFFYDYYVSEVDFVTSYFLNDDSEQNSRDTICDFKDAFPKLYNLFNRDFNIKNMFFRKINAGQYLVEFKYKGKANNIIGSLDELPMNLAIALDKILANDKRQHYRIYTSLENNDFYKQLVILRNDEVPYFDKATGINLTTLTN